LLVAVVAVVAGMIQTVVLVVAVVLVDTGHRYLVKVRAVAHLLRQALHQLAVWLTQSPLVVVVLLAHFKRLAATVQIVLFLVRVWQRLQAQAAVAVVLVVVQVILHRHQVGMVVLVVAAVLFHLRQLLVREQQIRGEQVVAVWIMLAVVAAVRQLQQPMLVAPVQLQVEQVSRQTSRVHQLLAVAAAVAVVAQQAERAAAVKVEA